jgi:ABC-type amino acid transport substrate-binding protein
MRYLLAPANRRRRYHDNRRAPEKVAFTSLILSNVREIVVTGDEVPNLESAEALSGKKVATRRSTSYYESLTKLNEQLVALGKPPVIIKLVPDTLESEELKEMTAAELLPAVVVDDWIARLRLEIIRGLKLHPNAVLREGGQIAWALRPDYPKLLATLDRAIASIDGNALQWAGEPHQNLSGQAEAVAYGEPGRRHATLS